MQSLRATFSFLFGPLYHPVLHRWRHRAEFRLHRQVLRESLAVMRRHRADFSSGGPPSGNRGRTAIQVHVFYTDLLPEFYGHLKGISAPYDLFVSTDTEGKKSFIEAFFREHLLSGNPRITVQVFENRGRDVYPFLAQLHGIYDGYEYAAHFHTKKSLHTDLGDYWRKSLLEILIGDGSAFDEAVAFLDAHPECGLLLPHIPKKRRGCYAVAKTDEWNDAATGDCLSLFDVKPDAFRLRDYEFPIGTMFIARTEAVRQVFAYSFSASDFPDEMGQVEHTLQHALELVWHPVCGANGFDFAVM